MITTVRFPAFRFLPTLALLLLWTNLGWGLRTIELTRLPPWTDECATIAFSGGNSFSTVPLNQTLSTEQLMQPLWVRSDRRAIDVVERLRTESTHPPLYFLLAHQWMQWWSAWHPHHPLLTPTHQDEDYENQITRLGWEQREVLLQGARLLPAIFGTLSIPLIFAIAWSLFHSLAIAQIAAGLMAVSPFAVSLAREARHYTLVLLLVLGSMYYTIALLQAALDPERNPQPPLLRVPRLAPPQTSRPLTRPLTRTLERSTAQPRLAHTPWQVWWLLPQRVFEVFGHFGQLRGLGVLWGLMNAFGMAVHYFFGLTLAIEAATVGFMLLWGQWGRLGGVKLIPAGSRRVAGSGGWLGAPWLEAIAIAVFITSLGIVIWIPSWAGLGDHRLTDWVYDGQPGLAALFRLLLWLVVMFFALPTDETLLPTGLLIVAGLALLGWFGLLLRWVLRGLQLGRRSLPLTPTMTVTAMVGLGLGAILTITYGLQSDLTLAARFSYPYFPAVILLAAIGLGALWQQGQLRPAMIILTASTIGAMIMTQDVTYLQHHRPDHMAAVIAEHSTSPVLLVSTHKHHGQTGRLMGIAWELGRYGLDRTPLNFQDPNSSDLRYLLVHRPDHKSAPAAPLNPASPSDPPEQTHLTTAQIIQSAVRTRLTPIDLWLLNVREAVELEPLGCKLQDQDYPDVLEYSYDHYVCR